MRFTVDKNIFTLLTSKFNIRNLLLFVIALSFIGSTTMVVQLGSFHLFPFRIGLIILLYCSLLAVIIKQGKIYINVCIKNYILFTFCWFVYASFSLLWALSTMDAVRNIFYLLCCVLTIMFVVIFFNNVQALNSFYRVWLVMLALSLIIGLWNYRTGVHLSSASLFDAPEYRRYIPTAFYYNQNDFATYVAIGVPFLIAYIRYHDNKLKKIAGIIFLSLSIFLLLITRSRANIIGLALGLFFWFIFILGSRGKFKVVLCILLLLIMILPFYSDYLQEILHNTLLDLRNLTIEDSSAMTRMNLIKNSITFLVNSYGFGVGAGNAEFYMANFARYETGNIVNVHNWWVEILVNYGIIIFTGYIVFYVGIFWNLLIFYSKLEQKAEKIICESILVGLVIFAVGCIGPSSVMAFMPQWLLISFALAFINYYRINRKYFINS